MAMTDDERDDAAELASWLPSRKLRARLAELEQLVCDQREVLLTQKRDRDAALATIERVRAIVTEARGSRASHYAGAYAVQALKAVEAALTSGEGT